MVDRAADSIDTDISHLNGKFSSRITLSWLSSRLIYLNKKRNISEIKIGREYCFELKNPCQPAPETFNRKVHKYMYIIFLHFFS